jgi:hypothetical protein
MMMKGTALLLLVGAILAPAVAAFAPMAARPVASPLAILCAQQAAEGHEEEGPILNRWSRYVLGKRKVAHARARERGTQGPTPHTCLV